MGQPHRSHRGHAVVAARGADRGTGGPDRDSVASAHGRYSRIHQFAAVYLPSIVGRVHVPAGDDRWRRSHAHGANNAQLIERSAAPDQSRSGASVDERPVDDGIDRRLRRRRIAHASRARRAGHWRLYGKKWFTSAITSQMALTLGASGRQRSWRRRSRDVLCRDARRGGTPERHARRATEGQAGYAQGADGGAAARRREPSWSVTRATARATSNRCWS